MPGRSRGRPMFDVRPEAEPEEDLYPGYPGYGEHGDVYDDHDSRERESARDREAGPSRSGRSPAVARPAGRNGSVPDGPRDGASRGGHGIGPDGRWDDAEPPLYGGRATGVHDGEDEEPLYARDYARQGHDFGDPDEDPRDRQAGRAPGGYAADDTDGDYDDYDTDDDYDYDYDDPDDGYDDPDDGQDYDDDEYGVGDAPLSVPPPGRDGRPLGPADVEELDPSMTDALARVDLGSMQVPVPYGAELKLEPADGGRPQAVHLTLPEGRIAISALAAPRSSGLWRELSAEIETSLRAGGARVRNAHDDWGRELHARTENAASVFIGADGPRWMVYGVATASLDTVDALDVELRRVMRGVIVVRGKLPYPPRTVLPLALPARLADKQPEAAQRKGASITVSVPAAKSTGATPRPGSTGATPAPAPAGATPPAPAANGRPAAAPVGRPPARPGEADPGASTRSLPQVARSGRREAPGAREAAAARAPREPATSVTGARPVPVGHDGDGQGAGADTSTGLIAVPRPEGVARPADGRHPGRYPGDRHDGGPADDARHDDARHDRTAEGERRAVADRAAAGGRRPRQVPDEPTAVRGTGGRAPEPVEPPVRRDPAVTALSPADLVPDPASLRGPAARRGPDHDRSRGQDPRRRRADRPRSGPGGTPAADLLRTAGPSTRSGADDGPDPWSSTDTGVPTPPEPATPSRMAIEDIPLVDVPLLEAELDSAPVVPEASIDPGPPPLPRRQPRDGRNGAPRHTPAEPGPDGPRPGGSASGRRRRRGDAETGDRPADASSWMSAEIAARPGGRHARPGGHRDPATADERRSPFDPEPSRTVPRPPLTDWRDTEHRRTGGPGADEDDLFGSPAGAGRGDRRNGSPAGDRRDRGTEDASGAPDPGRHRR